MSCLEAYLEDNRPTLDEVCEAYDECNKGCPSFWVCQMGTDMKKLEKAIKFFQDMKECTYDNLEEVDMAIHALEQERIDIEKLEIIKSDLVYLSRSLSFFNQTTMVCDEDKKQLVALEDVKKIFNKYISELKGDNKYTSRCNSCQNNTDELSGECYECVKGIEDWYEPVSKLKGENEKC